MASLSVWLRNWTTSGMLAAFCAASSLMTPVAAFAADSAILDSGRSADEKARDADRKPLEMLEFAHVKPGETVIDYIPGKGYFTRLFSNAVGPSGTVYADTPQLIVDKFKDKLPPPVSAETGRGNVHEIVSKGDNLGATGADLVWTSQNYHDVHIWAGAKGTAELNKSVFDALKPGGLYVVLDHAGAAGLDDAGMSKLHRIDEALVIKEVTAAGFVLDGESKILRNPGDNHELNVFDPAIRSKTDQFVLRFRKPG